MQSALETWLAGVGSWAWHTALVLFLVLNGVAALALLGSRSRALVNQWTGRWLGANLALLGLGLGTPLVTTLLRWAVALLPGLGAVRLSK